MIDGGIELVGWSDSYLLGWGKVAGVPVFFVQVLLPENHQGYVPFDDNLEHGCYRLAVLEFNPSAKLVGLPTEDHAPVWDEKVGEFVDVAEIETVSILDSGLVLETDEFTVEAITKSVVLKMIANEGMRAFDRIILKD